MSDVNSAAGGPGSREGDRWCWTHVTQPLCTDGSALNNVIRELSREAVGAGIRSAVAGSGNRGYVFPHAELLPVDFTRYLSAEYLTPRQLQIDAVTGRSGFGRRWVDRLYRPVAEALDATDGPVVVHDGLLGAAGLVTLHRRHPGRPLHLYVHNSLSRSYSRRELRRFLSLADSVICVSAAVRDAIARRLGDHPTRDRLVVVLNGVDSDRFHPPALPVERPALLFVGMISPVKGPHVLVEALGLLSDRVPAWTATFLGSTTHAEGLELSAYEQELRRSAAALGDRIRFTPFVPNTELPDIYRRHSIFVLASQFDDPCPLVLFEAMATGLAVTASRRGGIPEIGGDAVEYFDDAARLAGLLDRLITDGDERSRWGSAARVRAVGFPWSRALDSLRTVIGDRP